MSRNQRQSNVADETVRDVIDTLDLTCSIIRHYNADPAHKKRPIKAVNDVSTDKVGVVFNFLQIPDSLELMGVDTTILTLSALRNHKRSSATLPQDYFQRLTNSIGLVLRQRREIWHKVMPGYYQDDLWKRNPDNLYDVLDCHRVFLFYTQDFGTLWELLFKPHRIQLFKQLGVQEVDAVYRMDCHYGYETLLEQQILS